MSCKKVTRVRVKVQDISGGEIPDHNEVQEVGRYGGVGVEVIHMEDFSGYTRELDRTWPKRYFRLERHP